MPHNVAINPTPFERAKYVIAVGAFPLSIRRTVSREYEEKVVNPPRKPTMIPIRSSVGMSGRSTPIPYTIPIRNDPRIFIKKVPSG